MTPPAVRDAIAAHLTDELDVHPHLAALTAAGILDQLAGDGWHITTGRPARPVAPRAREPRARRIAACLRPRRAHGRTKGARNR